MKDSIKRVPEEIATMNNLPKEFNELYIKLIKSENIEEMKELSTILMKSVKEFSKEMKVRVTLKEEIKENDIRGSYEEVYSNWRNKMYHAVENNDTYLSLMTAASCQSFYDDMYNEYNIEKIDIMKRLSNNDLKEATSSFDEAMEEYKKNYDRINIKIVKYKNLDDFEEWYLRI